MIERRRFKTYIIAITGVLSSIFLLSFCFTKQTMAEGASLYLSPASGTFFTGSTFSVSILLNTGGKDVNTVRADLKFNPKKIQITNPTASRSFISVWVSQPSYSNLNGTASFQGGIPSPGINTSSALVSTITFRAVAPGENIISILDSSKVLLDDGKGTDILTSLGSGNYNVVVPPPAGPRVFSPSHPDQNGWYKDNNVSFGWEKEQGVSDFSYIIDHDFHTIPDNVSEGGRNSISYSDLEDGLWYFHVKAKKEGGWGGTSHYLAQIDNTAPADFDINFVPEDKSIIIPSKEPFVEFITTDNLSGIDHFEIKVVDLRKNLEKDRAEFFIETTTPYKIPSLGAGEYEIVVKAYDKAMNYISTSRRIEVIPVDKLFYVTKSGMSIKSFFLYWWQAVLILTIIVIPISAVCFIFYRRHKAIKQKGKILIGLKDKIKKERNEVKKKLKNN